MKNAVFYVDFNEMLEKNLVLFSKNDVKQDFEGNPVPLYEGMEVNIFSHDMDAAGRPDNLLAFGRLEKNNSKNWSSHVKWCCRIDSNGIRHQSEI